jgi:hypothetical protein
MPTTVPSRPSSGEMVATVPTISTLRSMWATSRAPTSSTASLISAAVGAVLVGAQGRGHDEGDARAVLLAQQQGLAGLALGHQRTDAVDEGPREHLRPLGRPQALEEHADPDDRGRQNDPHERAALFKQFREVHGAGSRIMLRSPAQGAGWQGPRQARGGPRAEGRRGPRAVARGVLDVAPGADRHPPHQPTGPERGRHGGIAQLGEHRAGSAKVRGSIPLASTSRRRKG